MTATFKLRWAPLLVAVGLASPLRAAPAPAAYHVTGLLLTGVQRSDRRWLESYVDYQFPAVMTPDDGAQLQRKLMTTAVFSSVTVTFDPTGTAGPQGGDPPSRAPEPLIHAPPFCSLQAPPSSLITVSVSP